MSTSISVNDLKAELLQPRRPQVVDVRTPSEFAGGHIPGAVNIPMDQFEARQADVNLAERLVLVCKTGTRSQLVAGWLPAAAPVCVLAGGTEAWIKDGQPVVVSVVSRWSLERQVRFIAGLLVLCGTLAVVAGLNKAVWIALFIGAGLTFAGATDICLMGMLLVRLPWNKARRARGESCTP